MTPPRPTPRLSQRGFSLTELMVAMTVGLILVGGVIQVFASSKAAFTLQQGGSRAQESGRVGTLILSRTARAAGYYPLNPAEGFTQAATLFPTGTRAIGGTEGGANPDSLVIRFYGHADGSVLDCFGGVIGAGVLVSNTFRLSAVDPATGTRSLECVRTIGAATETQPIIEGVSDFQVEYGIDTLGALPASNPPPDQYVAATAVADWSRVRSLRYRLVTNSVESVGAGAATGGRLTRTYIQTVDLRNQ